MYKKFQVEKIQTLSNCKKKKKKNPPPPICCAFIAFGRQECDGTVPFGFKIPIHLEDGPGSALGLQYQIPTPFIEAGRNPLTANSIQK